MNYKVEYISRLFQKTSYKAIENYCLTRLWHRLDDDQIKIVPQQYVNRHIDKYALTDVYLPQVQIHIEVNEPAHYESSERIEADDKRKKEIESQTGHKLFTIDCRNDLTKIHAQIDSVVTEIKERVNKQIEDLKFKPWQPDIERNPDYWKSKKIISVEDEVSMNNIEDICKLFNADFNKTIRGFQRLGGLSHPQNNNILLWWPSEVTRQGWLNRLDEIEYSITETHSDEIKKGKHFQDHFNTKQLRCVFFHYKDILGLTSYKFKGVFAYDSEKSQPAIGTVWKRIDDKIKLDLYDE